MRGLIGLAAVALATSSISAQVPRAIGTDPPRDSAHPARMEVLHIPSGGVRLNGVAYLASGAGRHPTFIFFHGLPGNEKNLDLAQAVRRAGWNAIAVNYRGSWGSPGAFRFGGNLEDADAVLAFLRDTTNARSLGVDPRRLVIAGHSMGGWVTALTAAHHPELLGAILISAADLGLVGAMPRVDTWRCCSVLLLGSVHVICKLPRGCASRGRPRSASGGRAAAAGRRRRGRSRSRRSVPSPRGSGRSRSSCPRAGRSAPAP